MKTMLIKYCANIFTLIFLFSALTVRSQTFEYLDSTNLISVNVISIKSNRIKACIRIENKVNNLVSKFFFKGEEIIGDYETEDFIDGYSYPLIEYNDNNEGWLAIEKDNNKFCRLIIIPGYKKLNLNINKILVIKKK